MLILGRSIDNQLRNDLQPTQRGSSVDPGGGNQQPTQRGSAANSEDPNSVDPGGEGAINNQL